MRRLEYGGYIEIEQQSGEELYSDALALNCGRNCLAFLIEKKNIQKIYLPYFLCSSVSDVCFKYSVEIVFYDVDISLRPIFLEPPKGEDWVYLVNYYGQISNDEIKEWKRNFPNLIVDNAQAFFQPPVKGVDTLYTCRKFFGVADGAYLFTNVKSGKLEQDHSYDRMRFLMGRYEKSANEFYAEYKENNKMFRKEPIKSMSKLTHNILRGIDYGKVSDIRENNYNLLHTLLHDLNKLSLSVPSGAYMYPLYIEHGVEIREKLRKEKIYIPILWPNVLDNCNKESMEYDLAENILPLPVDQRYDEEDMKFIAEEIDRCLNK